MYKTLWNFINKITDKESAVGVYLAVNIICWTALTVILGTFGTLLLHIQLAEVLGDIVCAGAYAGIIFGLIGGVLFLQRRTEES